VCSIHRVFLFSAVIITAGVFYTINSWAQNQPRETPGSLAEQVKQHREKHNLVGLAAMVMVDGKVVDSAANGERETGSGVSVEVTDRWHLGSITKSITATMIARLIESGQMKWDQTVSDLFPNEPIHAEWESVTVWQLLTHTAGAPKNFSLRIRSKKPTSDEDTKSERLKAVLEILAEEPEYPPGTRKVYSNIGFTIAGAMAEQATGKTWNDLIEQETFDPLELTLPGFGPPEVTRGQNDQPVGHRTLLGLKVAMGDKTDNTPIMAPGNAVHMSLKDLCRYADAHMQGELGSSELLSPETWRLLHTPELEDYACGWVKKVPTWKIPQTHYWHNGSNTMWYALVVFVPKKELVVAVTSNDGDIKNAETAAWEIVRSRAAQIDPERDQQLRKTLPTQAFPKQAPFAALRWNEETPEIQVDDHWVQLVSIDAIPVADIVKFSQTNHGDKWQKRFGEDLFEMMFHMGHEPGATVDLVVRSPESANTTTLSDVPMTRENRRAIWKANAE